MTPPIAHRLKENRQTLRVAGLRPLRLWVPDTNRAGFAAECRRQSQIVAAAVSESERPVWLEQLADTDGWR